MNCSNKLLIVTLEYTRIYKTRKNKFDDRIQNIRKSQRISIISNCVRYYLNFLLFRGKANVCQG